MRRLRIGVHWWLGAAFATVAAVTALAVLAVFSARSQHAFRSKTEELTAGTAFVIARQIGLDVALGKRVPLRRLAAGHGVALALYDRRGRPLGSTVSPPPLVRRPALRSVLRGQRYATSSDNGRRVVVGLPLHTPPAAGLVVVSTRPDLSAALGIIKHQTLWAAVLAVLAGGLFGLLVARLVSRRLRRLAAVAEAIRAGDFEQPVEMRFGDEFSSVAAALEQMRLELRRSFGDLEFERDRLRLLLERLQEGIVTVNRDLAVQFANGAARRILGRRLREGEPLPGSGPAAALRPIATALFESADPRQQRLLLEDARVVSVVGIPARGAPDTVVLVLADLTDAEERELSEREFVANAAHELRTPLTTIIGAVEVLQAGAKEDPAERDRFLAHIEREAGRLARLARALLVLARAQTTREEIGIDEVELRPLLEDVAVVLTPRDGVTVDIECADELVVETSGELLEQALRNLAENAAKHTSDGRIVLRALRLDGSLRIEVEDTGPGMTAQTQRHVFERFYRGQGRDPDGFGLGLAIVSQAVHALGGRIELDSEPGGGSRFTIVLDRRREAAAA
jgi:signal transduction histidine kinase/HAMP domain-containing protein